MHAYKHGGLACAEALRCAHELLPAWTTADFHRAPNMVRPVFYPVSGNIVPIRILHVAEVTVKVSELWFTTAQTGQNGSHIQS